MYDLSQNLTLWCSEYKILLSRNLSVAYGLMSELFMEFAYTESDTKVFSVKYSAKW